MSRFKLLSRPSRRGIDLFYECSPLTHDASPFMPIYAEERFPFRIKVNDPEFWYYAEVNNWTKDKVFFLTNPMYNATGDIPIYNGPLNAPVLYKPMIFSYDVEMQNGSSLLQVSDRAGNILRNIPVRARSSADAPGTKLACKVDLTGYEDGLYTLHHHRPVPVPDEQVYCCSDYQPGILAMVEITYKSDPAWTGVEPFQRYQVEIDSRSAFWYYTVHIQNADTILASDLSISHIPSGAEPIQTFSVNDGPDDVDGFVEFKSDNPLAYAETPMHLKLLHASVDTVMEQLPQPSAITIQIDSTNQLCSKIIVNI